MRINDVELVPERTIYKVDASGRIIIPSYLRTKFEVEIGDFMDYYTAYVDGEWFLCAKKHKMTPEELERLKDKGKI
jgi:bifunctional DNA-binding transcriptional regulator/antitoxin component of YhaV-PrlF toxin-antitoxin module